MSNISIFKQGGAVTSSRAEGMSELAKSLATNTNNSRRITMNKGKFSRVVGGEQAGGKVAGSINVIIINALPKVSRQFYAKPYDPNGEPTLPDCWSNLGDVPDTKASNAQGSSCATCPQKIGRAHV